MHPSFVYWCDNLYLHNKKNTAQHGKTQLNKAHRKSSKGSFKGKEVD